MTPWRSLTAVAAVLVLALVVACGSSDEEEPAAELHFLNWEDYIDPAILEGFEAEYGIVVHVHTFEDEPEVVSRLASPGAEHFDVFVVSGTVIGELAESRLLAELDHDRIPNLSNIDPAYLDKPWDRGNRYSVPYDWGTTGIIYDKRYVTPGELSWSLLRDPDVAPHAALDSDPGVVLGLTLLSLGHPMNSTDADHLEEAVEVLQEQVRNGIRFEDAFTIRGMMIAGDLWAAQVFNGEAAIAMAENPNLAFFVPVEGSDIYFDVFAIPRDAANKIGAELFLNYIMRPEVHAAATAYTGYENPNAEAVRLGLVELGGELQQAVHESAGRLQAWEVYDDEAYSAWNRAWAQVLSAQSSGAAR